MTDLRHTGTKETTPFHIFKHEVTMAAGIAVDQIHIGRLHAAYDAGEPVWMVADEMKLRAKAFLPPVKPFKFPSLKGEACIRRVKF
ncbi:MAG TPA: hypothetical protein VI358_18175 [Pseudolabrys sp.]